MFQFLVNGELGDEMKNGSGVFGVCFADVEVGHKLFNY
jgi:hypothetical protein